MKIAQTQNSQRSMAMLPNIQSKNTLPRNCPIIKKQVVGRISYYAWVDDIILFMTLNKIAAEQFKTTKFIVDTIEQLLDYCTTNPNTNKRFENTT